MLDAMIDSGATGIFMDRTWAQTRGIQPTPLDVPLEVVNIDDSKNQGGLITHFARMRMIIDDHDEELDFLLTDIGREQVILGTEWLRRHNPIIDWINDHVDLSRCPKHLHSHPTPNPDIRLDPEFS
jgi:hypothetical protein